MNDTTPIQQTVGEFEVMLFERIWFLLRSLDPFLRAPTAKNGALVRANLRQFEEAWIECHSWAAIASACMPVRSDNQRADLAVIDRLLSRFAHFTCEVVEPDSWQQGEPSPPVAGPMLRRIQDLYGQVCPSDFPAGMKGDPKNPPWEETA